MDADSNAAPRSRGSGDSAWEREKQARILKLTEEAARQQRTAEAAPSLPASTDLVNSQATKEAGIPQLEQVAMDARQAFTSPAFRQMPKPRRAGYALAGAWKSKIGEEPSRRQAMEIARQCNALNRWQLTTDQWREAAEAMREAYPKSIGKVDVASFAEQVKEAFERHAPPGNADFPTILTLASGAELTKLEWQVLAMAALIQHARDGQPVVTAQSAWGNALGVSQPRISGVLATLRRDGFLADAGTGYMPPSGGNPGRAKEHRVTPKGMDAMAPVLADHPPGSLLASADAESAQVLVIEGKPPSSNELDRLGKARRAEIERDWYQRVKQAAEAQGIRAMRGRTEVSMTVRESTRKRDESNVRSGAEKVILDGLVNAGMIADDGPDSIDAKPAEVKYPPPRITPAERKANWQAQVRIELKPLADDGQRTAPDPQAETGEGG